MKLKKQQKESERCRKIEQDNFMLLQKMNYIMRTNRVDNTWKSPVPNFLNKIAIYNTSVPEIDDTELHIDLREDKEVYDIRKSKCIACSPHKTENLKVCYTQ